MKILVALFLVGASAFAAPSTGASRNVILLTLDGVRYEELFGKPDPALIGGRVLASEDREPAFSYFLKSLAPNGVVLGEPKGRHPMHTGNPHYVSLPGYQAILTGRTQPCADNDCGRVTEETLPERLKRELKLEPGEVATIASWDEIAHAAESHAGATFVNAGPTERNEQAPPWPDARFDRFTFAHGLRYLKAHRPRFLFLSLNDADEWGHKNEYGEYLKTLRQYDGWLKELGAALRDMGDYGKQTCLMVTTDHGRGTGKRWTSHGPDILHAEDVWLYTDCFPANQLDARPEYSHLDIRPTVEALLGLPPRSCEKCGKSLLKPLG